MRGRVWPRAAALAGLVLAVALVGWGAGALAPAESSDGEDVLEQGQGEDSEPSDELDLALGVAAGSEATRYESELALVDETERVLEERKGRGDCVVSKAGYLDLAGRTWGCVLQGDGWAEVLVVSEDEEGTGCEVVSWRMDAEDAERALEGGS